MTMPEFSNSSVRTGRGGQSGVLFAMYLSLVLVVAVLNGSTADRP
ncbi:hypothetical protein [Kitasatospora aureofaciens]